MLCVPSSSATVQLSIDPPITVCAYAGQDLSTGHALLAYNNHNNDKKISKIFLVMG